MIERLRLKRIAKSYRRIAKSEVKLTSAEGRKEAGQLRVNFASDTLNLIDIMHKNGRISRTERRQWRRRLISGHVQ